MAEELKGGKSAADRRAYEPPRVKVFGTIADLTQGVVPTTTDGVLPGSIL